MRFLTTLSAPLLLLLTGASLFSTLSNSPAFNEALREESVFGSRQLQFSAAMYEEPSYLFQIGTSFLRADLITSEETGAASDYASSETAFQRADHAGELFTRSVETDPANAHAWASLAWAKTLTGDTDMARKALLQSWQLAPYNRQLAERRANLFEALYAPDIPELSITPTAEERAAFERDLSILQRFDAATYREYTS